MLDRHERQTRTVLLQHEMDRLVGGTSLLKHFKSWCGEDGAKPASNAERPEVIERMRLRVQVCLLPTTADLTSRWIQIVSGMMFGCAVGLIFFVCL